MLCFQSLSCTNCDKEYHFHCLAATAPDGRKKSTFGVCKDCKTRIEFGVAANNDDDDDEEEE